MNNPRTWKVLGNMISIVVCALGTVPKGLEKSLGQVKIRGKTETLWKTVLRWDRILERIPWKETSLISSMGFFRVFYPILTQFSMPLLILLAHKIIPTCHTQNTKNTNCLNLLLIQTIGIQLGYRDRIWQRKCIMVKRRSGKLQMMIGIELPNQERIRTFGEKEIYE